MIQASELRKGNLLETLDEEAEIIAVDQIDGIEETVGGNGLNDIPIKDLAPIHINDKWLISLGFKKRKHNVGANVWAYYIKDGYGYEEICLLNDGGDNYSLPYIPITVKYIHTLQNFYFATTLKELQRK